eukprot:TRINITY_DN4809_c0_g1_i3.p1 TRINITY_DN4809_c0_g1~~TRINITY_DN4809_c0_g1_i3.p1  ORF type:complete len:431 (+),score=121.26 TRINITY_DN4809_c0_g1_i3:987-2279(+)
MDGQEGLPEPQPQHAGSGTLPDVGALENSVGDFSVAGLDGSNWGLLSEGTARFNRPRRKRDKPEGTTVLPEVTQAKEDRINEWKQWEHVSTTWRDELLFGVGVYQQRSKALASREDEMLGLPIEEVILREAAKQQASAMASTGVARPRSAPATPPKHEEEEGRQRQEALQYVPLRPTSATVGRPPFTSATAPPRAFSPPPARPIAPKAKRKVTKPSEHLTKPPKRQAPPDIEKQPPLGPLQAAELLERLYTRYFAKEKARAEKLAAAPQKEKEELIKQGKLKVLDERHRRKLTLKLHDASIEHHQKVAARLAKEHLHTLETKTLSVEKMEEFVERIYYAQRRKEEIVKAQLVKKYMTDERKHLKLTRETMDEQKKRMYDEQMVRIQEHARELTEKYLDHQQPATLRRSPEELKLISRRLFTGTNNTGTEA